MCAGNLETELQRHLGPVGSFFVVRRSSAAHRRRQRPADADARARPPQSFILHPTPFGALTQLWAGTTANGAQVNGAVRPRVLSAALFVRLKRATVPAAVGPDGPSAADGDGREACGRGLGVVRGSSKGHLIVGRCVCHTMVLWQLLNSDHSVLDCDPHVMNALKVIDFLMHDMPVRCIDATHCLPQLAPLPDAGCARRRSPTCVLSVRRRRVPLMHGLIVFEPWSRAWELRWGVALAPMPALRDDGTWAADQEVRLPCGSPGAESWQ
jgi:hypothetical protein